MWTEQDDEIYRIWCEVSTPERKNIIFNNLLKLRLLLLIESEITYFYKRYTKDAKWLEAHNLSSNTLSYLYEHMGKFAYKNLDRKGNLVKPSSYLRTIIRSYFRDNVRRNYNESKTYISLEEYLKDNEL